MTAFSTRKGSGFTSNGTVALTELCAHKVRAADTSARPKSGIFSFTREIQERYVWTRRKGQKSSNRRANGRVTSIGLAMRPKAMPAITGR